MSTNLSKEQRGVLEPPELTPGYATAFLDIKSVLELVEGCSDMLYAIVAFELSKCENRVCGSVERKFTT